MGPHQTARRPLPAALRERLTAEAGQLEGFQAIVRFGSHGTVYERPDSDLDLAFLGCRAWTPAVLGAVAARLDPLSELPVQCVDLRAVPGLVALEMLEHAEQVVVHDALALGLFQTHLDAERLNLACWRSGILEDIGLRGTARVANDVLLAKAATIERCLERVATELEAAGESFATDLTRQDAAMLNLLRACEAAIDGAMRRVRQAACGVPRDAREAFVLLESAGLLPTVQANALRRMVGFRNVAVHAYQDLDPVVTLEVLTHHQRDLADFARWLVAEGMRDETGP